MNFPDRYRYSFLLPATLPQKKTPDKMRNIIYTFIIFCGFFGYTASPARAADHVDSTGTGIDPAPGGTISGHVTTADGAPAAAVTVLVRGTDRSALTDEDGNFALRNLSPGIYTLEISLTGFATLTQTVTVEQRTITTVPIRLTLSGQQLQGVVITGGLNRFSRRSSDQVAKMPLKNTENPQVYTTITKELLADQLVFSVDDAMKNATGVQKMWDATGRSGDGGSYYNSRGFIMQSKLRNGIAGNVTSKIDAANLERIEVIKGPSATLFGSTLTSYGGLINRVTKKPYGTSGGELSYAGGNFGFNRLSADLNTPLDSARKVLLRVNTAYTDQGSFQDNGFSRNFALAPSLSYKVNDRLSFLFDAEIYRGRNLGTPIFFFPYGQTIASMGVSRADKLPIDYRRSFFSDDLSQQSAGSNYFAEMSYTLSAKWSTRTNVTVTNSYSDGPGPYFYLLSNSAVTGNAADIGADYISRNDQFTANSRDRMIEIQQNLNGDFNIGSLRNRLVAGLDFFNHNSNQLFSGGTYDTILNHGDIPTYRNFNRTSLQELYATKGVDFYYPVDFISNTYSVYASDVLNLRDNLMVLAALRADHFVNNGTYDVTTGNTSGGYNQTALSPKFGIVYQPVADKLSLFANYQNGFTNQTGADKNGVAFKPEQAWQGEAGVKLDLFGGRLTSTLSYYDIKVKDILRTDPTNPLYSIQNGTQLSKGVEAEVIANPLQGLNIVGGFSYNDSRYEQADADVTGRRPSTASSPYTANWWISYRLPSGAAKGLGFGFGGNYASDNKVINSVSQGVFILPANTILNASVFYEYAKCRFSVKTGNLTNQKYWIGYTTVNPQPLRSVVASATFKF